MPLAIIGNSFSEAWDRMDARAEIIFTEQRLDKEKAEKEKERQEKARYKNPLDAAEDEEVVVDEEAAEGELDVAASSGLEASDFLVLTAKAHVLAAMACLDQAAVTVADDVQLVKQMAELERLSAELTAVSAG